VRSKPFELCCEVLRRLEREGVLEHVILIGSWCLLAYEDLFSAVRYRAGIRTRDIDFLIPVPPQFDHDVDLEAVLRDLDFVISLLMKTDGSFFWEQGRRDPSGPALRLLEIAERHPELLVEA